MKNKILFLLLAVFLISLAFVSAAEKPVLFATDDFQMWWLTGIQDSLVQVYVDNNIPVTLGVIPAGITEPWGEGERFSSAIQEWDSHPNIEVAQHGYDHEVYLEGMSYSAQYNDIKKGDDLLMSIGVYPTSFIPPFGSADANTVKVLNALGFHTLYNPVEMSPTQDDDLLIIQDQIILTRDGDEGPDSVYKTYSTLKSEIDQKLNQYGVALVLFHMQDFNKGTDNSPVFDTSKANQIVNYANQLENDGYTLMTVEQYYQSLNNPQPPAEIDNDNDGYDETEDCNDNNANIHPGASDNNCNNIDENCNGQADEGYVSTTTHCGVGVCAATGTLSCVSGATVDSCVAGLPGNSEICGNGLDDNCDGKTDTQDTLSCPVYVCGDGIINQANETCDLGNLNGATCASLLGAGYTGTLSCTLSCTYNTALCVAPVVQTCGNSIIEGTETCDSNSQSCTTAQGYSGTQSCNAQCDGWNTCTSSQFCGDNLINGNEQCDGSSLNGKTCATQLGAGYTGILSCSSCTFNTALCVAPVITPVCGNDILESGEQCDKGLQNGVICLASYGKTCSYCSSQCQTVNVQGPYCGDNVCANGETCLSCSKDCGTCFSRVFQRFWWTRFQLRN